MHGRNESLYWKHSGQPYRLSRQKPFECQVELGPDNSWFYDNRRVAISLESEQWLTRVCETSSLIVSCKVPWNRHRIENLLIVVAILSDIRSNLSRLGPLFYVKSYELQKPGILSSHMIVVTQVRSLLFPVLWQHPFLGAVLFLLGFFFWANFLLV